MLPVKILKIVNFLTQIASQKKLSEEEKQVFVAYLSSDKTQYEIAHEINMSKGNLKYHMGKVYEKFEIDAKNAQKPKQLLTNLLIQSLESPPLDNSIATSEEDEIDNLVEKIRQQRQEKIQDRCGKITMFGCKPVLLGDIYTNVNILEKTPKYQSSELSDFQAKLKQEKEESDEFRRLIYKKIHGRQSEIPALDVVAEEERLIIIGQLGTGKTTLCQKVAIDCNSGKLKAKNTPIFIPLKPFAENTRLDNSEEKLFNYISKEFAKCGIDDRAVQTILNKGRTSILLDALDEVSEADIDMVISTIKKFISDYFKNQFIITCRTGNKRYKAFSSENFTQVEIAEFNSEQIENFAHNWFNTVCKQENGEALAREFIEKLKLPENTQIRELAVTPILLNLTCLVFERKREFPQKRFELYEEGLNILLEEWDECKGIKRDKFAPNFYGKRKIDLLTEVAYINFKENRYFFKKDELEPDIANYLATLNPETDRITLLENSEKLLEEIEAHHGLLTLTGIGIYSFSHLSFQEYFTAKKIMDISKNNPEIYEKIIRQHLHENRWNEVIKFILEMLPDGQ